MKMSQKYPALFFIILLIITGCGKAHWGYEGKEGPEHWGDLSKEFILCKEGKMQSPIDISGHTGKTKIKLEYNYSDVPLDMVNNGHAIQVNYEGKSHLTIDKKKYLLLQFHFHAPSEGAINGKRYDLCAHLVHKSKDGELAVIGVYFQKGAENSFLKQFWNRIPNKSGSKVSDPSVKVNAAGLLPGKKSFYHFMGSLTTPPCSEGVKWFVMDKIISLSQSQLKVFTDIYSKNARPLQPLNGRKISRGL